MKTMKLRHVARLINSNVNKVVDPTEIAVRLCNYVHVYRNDRIVADLDLDYGSASEEEIKRFGLRRDDVVITKDSEDRSDIAVPAYVPEDMPGVVCGYHLAILRPDTKRMRGDFLAWSLRSRNLQDAAMLGALGVTRYGLSQSAIKSLDIPCPDLDDQRDIAAFLDRETGRIDRILNSIGGPQSVRAASPRSFLHLLVEKRRALITAAVNGQISPEAWRRRGDTDRRLDRIEAEMAVEAAE